MRASRLLQDTDADDPGTPVLEQLDSVVIRFDLACSCDAALALLRRI